MILDKNGQPISSQRQNRVDGWWNASTDYGGQDDNIENTSYYPDYRLESAKPPCDFLQALANSWYTR